MTLKSKIARKALSQFLKNGIAKTSVDKICEELSISKKTFYVYFHSKDELMNEAINEYKKIICDLLKKIETENLSSAARLYIFFIQISFILSKISDDFFIDLKNQEALWADINSFRTKKLHSFFSKTYKTGTKEGLFENYPREIISQIFIEALRSVLNPNFILKQNYSVEKTLKISADFLFKGLLTSKGIEEYNALKKKYVS